MFTGIVQEVGSIVSVGAGKLIAAAGGILKDLQLGNSIAVNGVCLTVIAYDAHSFTVEVMPETLKKTNLGLLRPGEKVNLERPMALGGEIGGHLVQGHVDGTGEIVSITREGEARLIRFRADPDIMRFVVTKGFIAVDGASLTVVDKDEKSFSVSIVGYTLEHTILADRRTGDTVNLETDIIGKYVAEYMKPQSKGITAEFLRENGFPVN